MDCAKCGSIIRGPCPKSVQWPKAFAQLQRSPIQQTSSVSANGFGVASVPSLSPAGGDRPGSGRPVGGV